MQNEWVDEDASTCRHPLSERGLIVMAVCDEPHQMCMVCGSKVYLTDEALSRAIAERAEADLSRRWA